MNLVKIAALALLSMAAGCDGKAQAKTPEAEIKRVEIERMGFGEGVTVIHDDKRGVTCWVYDGFKAGGISCLPDWMLQQDASHDLKPEVSQ